jgi:NADH:ubiquinone oxidoreductase subunit C
MLTNQEKSLFLLSKKTLISIKILCDDISIKSQNILPLIALIKKQGYLLITGSAVDQINKYNRFLLVYIFATFSIPQRIYISTSTNLTAVSIMNLFSSAIWIEREIYDLFGIYFSNSNKSNDLRRLLTDYHFKGHPLRKDFSLIGYQEKIFSYLTKTIRTKHEVIF